MSHMSWWVQWPSPDLVLTHASRYCSLVRAISNNSIRPTPAPVFVHANQTSPYPIRLLYKPMGLQLRSAWPAPRSGLHVYWLVPPSRYPAWPAPGSGSCTHQWQKQPSRECRHKHPNCYIKYLPLQVIFTVFTLRLHKRAPQVQKYTFRLAF